MVAQESATLLAVLIANSERTYEETVEEYLRCARQNREKATLSARTLQRWARGRVVTTPRPSQRRVAKLYWGYPMATLLAPPPADGKIPPPESTDSPATTHGPTSDPTAPASNVNYGRTAPPAAGHPQPPDDGRAHPTAHAGEDSKEEDVMQRRTVLRALAGLATLTTPAFTTEGPRSDAGADEWESIATTYANLYYALPPAELINRLGAEMAALEHKAAGKDQTSLCRVAAQLSAVMALALASPTSLTSRTTMPAMSTP